MNTTTVHTLRYGNEPWLHKCVPTLETWCRRHGYQIRIWDDTDRGYPTPKFCEIDMIREFLGSGDGRMIYVDADVFVHHSAPEFPRLPGLAMSTDMRHQEHNYHWRDWAEDHYKIVTPKWEYSNAGVWSIDRATAAEFLEILEAHPMVEFFQEQHWFNACASQVSTFSRLPSEWNRYGRDFQPSWFWHLWGTTKDEDLETLRHLRLLDATPTSLRLTVEPSATPPSEKVVVLEFVQDAGLGNQLFEWAAGYGIAKSLGLPFRWMWRPSRKRDFGLTAFGIGENPYVETPLLVQRMGQGNRKFVEISKQRITDSKERHCGISCPFQAEECFADVADEIREIYKLEPFDLPHPVGTTPVGVQVRRGDYVGHPRLNVVTPEYFRNAMEWMRTKIDLPHFIIVSDDPEWCKRTFGDRADLTVMPPQEPIDGIRTLASCEAHIISNSTFGWWGAWLGEKGPVVVPEIWHHKPGSYGDWNPIPDRWHRVPVAQHAVPESVAAPQQVRVTNVIDYGPPKHRRAIVIPWHAGQEKWHELRYCLRSIDRFFEDAECPIYIMGTSRPGWLKENTRVQYIGAFTYREALMRGLQIAEKVLWMNDDIMFLKPTTWTDCEQTLYLKDVGPEFLEKAATQSNPWREGCIRVLRQLADEGIRDQKVFSTHTPYVFVREHVMETFQRFGIWDKFPMELAYFHRYAVNPTMMTDERTVGVPFGDSRFLNFTDRKLDPIVKDAIVQHFPDYAPWELPVKFLT